MFSMHLVREKQNLTEKIKVASQIHDFFAQVFPGTSTDANNTLCISRVFQELKKKLKPRIPMPFYTRTYNRIPKEPTTLVRESKINNMQKTLALNPKILGHF